MSNELKAFCVGNVSLPADRLAIEFRMQCGHPSETENWGARAYLSDMEIKNSRIDAVGSLLKNMRESIIQVIPQRLWSEMVVLIDAELPKMEQQFSCLRKMAGV